MCFPIWVLTQSLERQAKVLVNQIHLATSASWTQVIAGMSNYLLFAIFPKVFSGRYCVKPPVNCGVFLMLRSVSLSGYIPGYLRYIMVEILKNSFKATLSGSTAEQIAERPIHVLICLQLSSYRAFVVTEKWWRSEDSKLGAEKAEMSITSPFVLVTALGAFLQTWVIVFGLDLRLLIVSIRLATGKWNPQPISTNHLSQSSFSEVLPIWSCSSWWWWRISYSVVRLWSWILGSNGSLGKRYHDLEVSISCNCKWIL